MDRHCFLFAGSWSESPVSCHFRALVDELVRRGHRAVMLVDKQNHAVEDPEGNPAIYTWPSPRPTHWRDAMFLAKLIRRHRPNCVVAAFGATNLMLLVGRLLGVPCRVAWYLTLTEAIEIDSQMERYRLKLLRLRKRLVYSLATHVIPNSFAGSEDVQKVYMVPDEKCHVHYLSLPNREVEELRETVIEPRNEAICVGRLHPTKGQDVLIQAIARLKDRFPGTRFLFVGDGPCRDDCERLAAELGIAEQCRFVGRLPHDEVLRRLAASRVSVVPSRSECFGLVNLESLAAGTPVVASHVGGISEILHDGEEGFLVPPDDPESLAQRLAEILANADLRDEMGRKAKQRFQEFEQHRLIREQADWFEAILSARRVSPPAGTSETVTS